MKTDNFPFSHTVRNDDDFIKYLFLLPIFVSIVKEQSRR